MLPLLQRSVRQEWQVYEETKLYLVSFAPGSAKILTSLMSAPFHGVTGVFADQQRRAPRFRELWQSFESQTLRQYGGRREGVQFRM